MNKKRFKNLVDRIIGKVFKVQEMPNGKIIDNEAVWGEE